MAYRAVAARFAPATKHVLAEPAYGPFARFNDILVAHTPDYGASLGAVNPVKIQADPLPDARAAVQNLLPINGAAATAVLAFLGSVSASSTPNHVPRALVWALGSFGVGVFFAASMGVAAYATNHAYAEATKALRTTWTDPFFEQTEKSLQLESRAWRFHLAGYVSASATLLAFLVGVTSAAIGCTHLH